MGAFHPASARLIAPLRVLALASAALVAVACSHLPPLIPAADALSAPEHVQLGLSFEAQGLREDAAKQFEAAVRRDPACADCWMALGNFGFENGRLESAETAFRRALKAAPHHPGAENNLATALLARGGSLAEAEALALDALGRDGDLRPYILDTLANVYLRQGRFVEAAAAVRQAEAAAPADAVAVRVQLKATRAAVDAGAARE
jgi:tetratricopeptide (TPR) repeat protein